jgi:hypothetical protein
MHTLIGSASEQGTCWIFLYVFKRSWTRGNALLFSSNLGERDDHRLLENNHLLSLSESVILHACLLIVFIHG